jgi:hypothetical protein
MQGAPPKKRRFSVLSPYLYGIKALRPTRGRIMIEMEFNKMKTTEKAIKVEYLNGSIWLPFSKVEIDYNVGGNPDRVRARIPEWLAKAKGLV